VDPSGDKSAKHVPVSGRSDIASSAQSSLRLQPAGSAVIEIPSAGDSVTINERGAEGENPNGCYRVNKKFVTTTLHVSLTCDPRPASCTQHKQALQRTGTKSLVSF
jgi:hypothetical protein